MSAQDQKSLVSAPQSGAPIFAPLHREMDRFFAEFGHAARRLDPFAPWPKMEFAETKTSIEVTVEAPGMKEDELSIMIDGDLLTVSGEKKSEIDQKKKNYRLTEREYGAFMRTIRLPHHVDTDAIKAKLKDGVLKITAPKTGPDTSRKIEIQASKA